MDIKELKQCNYFGYTTSSRNGYWEGMIYIEEERIYLFQNEYNGSQPRMNDSKSYGYNFSYKVYPTESLIIRQTIIDNLEILPIIY